MLVPDLRFRRADEGDYPEWAKQRLGNIIDSYEAKVNADCALPVLTSSKINGIQFQNKHFGREQIHDIAGYHILPRGYCTYRNRSDGTDFTFNINNICDIGIVSKFYPVFKELGCNLRFLCYLLNNGKNALKAITYTAVGTSQKVLSFTDLKSMIIPIPCLEEQQKIADFLSDMDEVISASEAEVATLEQQKKGIMQKIFSQEVRFKKDDGAEYPEWTNKCLGEMCEIVGGGTPNTGCPDFWNGDVQWFTPTEVGRAKYVERSARTITKLGVEKSSAKFLPAGAILMTSRATLGEMSITRRDCCTNQGFQSLIVNSDNSVDYVYYLQCIIKPYCIKYAAGSTFSEISGKQLRKCVVPVPCLEEQQKIAAFLSDIDETIDLAKQELEQWKLLKKGLMQKMFV